MKVAALNPPVDTSLLHQELCSANLEPPLTAHFIYILRCIKEAVRRPAIPGIIQQVERLVWQSFKLDDEKARRILADIAFPISHLFDASDWASKIASCISRKDAITSRALEWAERSELTFSVNDTAVLFSALRRDPAHAAAVIDLVLPLDRSFTLVEWRSLLKSFRSGGNPSVIYTVFLRFKESPYRSDHSCNLLFCGAIGRVSSDQWTQNQHHVIFESCWRFALSRIPLDRDIFALASACIACEKYGLLTQLLTSRRRFSPHTHPRSFIGHMRRIHPHLPREVAKQIREAFGSDRIDPQLLLSVIASAPLPERLLVLGPGSDNTSSFVNASGALMRWMVNGLIRDSRAIFMDRVAFVIGQILRFSYERMREAMFGLLRTRGAYISNFHRKSMRAFEALSTTLTSLEDPNLKSLFSEPSSIRDQIRRLIDPPDFPMPDDATFRFSCMNEIAETLLSHQIESFSGIHRPMRAMLEQLSPLVDRLVDEGYDRANQANPVKWVSSWRWLIEGMASKVADLMTEDRYAHDFLNEFDRFWDDRMRKAAVAGASQMHEVRKSFVDRVDLMLLSRTGSMTGPRKAIRVDHLLRKSSAFLQAPYVPNRSVHSPNPLYLWLMDDQRKTAIIPLIQELLLNVQKALDSLSVEDRMFRLDVSLADHEWAKLSIRNSYDPFTARSSSTGSGTAIVNSICRRLRSRRGQTREPSFYKNADDPSFRTEKQSVKVFEQIVYLPLAMNSSTEAVSIEPV